MSSSAFTPVNALQPASASTEGSVTTTDQIFAGNKTFNNTVYAQNFFGNGISTTYYSTEVNGSVSSTAPLTLFTAASGTYLISVRSTGTSNFGRGALFFVSCRATGNFIFSYTLATDATAGYGISVNNTVDTIVKLTCTVSGGISVSVGIMKTD